MHQFSKTTTTLVPFDYGNEIKVSERNLPHWEQELVTYFITFRLADSIPVNKIKKWTEERDAWLRVHKEPFSQEEWKEYHAIYSTRIQKALDQGIGDCQLRNSDAREIVRDSLLFFDGERYSLGEWVIMPSHVHLLVTPHNGHGISKILQSWKSFSAKEMNKLINTTGIVWQCESYDHIVRSPAQLDVIEKYILENPTKAKLRLNEFDVSTPLKRT